MESIADKFRRSIRSHLGSEIESLIKEGILELAEEEVVFTKIPEEYNKIEVKVSFKLKASLTVDQLREENYKLRRQLEDIKTLLRK